MLVAESVVCSKIICELIESEFIVKSCIIELTLESCCLHLFEDDVDTNLSTCVLENKSCCLLEFLIDHDMECQLAWLVTGESKFFFCLGQVILINVDIWIKTKLAAVDVVVVYSSKSVISCVYDGFLIHSISKSLSYVYVVQALLLHLHRHIEHNDVWSLDKVKLSIRLNSFKVCCAWVDTYVDFSCLESDETSRCFLIKLHDDSSSWSCTVSISFIADK